MNGNSYGSVSFLKLQIEDLLNPNDNSLNSECREFLKLVYKQVESFEELAKKTLYTKLDHAITETGQKLRAMVAEIGSKSIILEDWVQNIKEEIQSFTPQLKMLEQKCSDGLYNVSLPDDEDDGDDHDVAVTFEITGVREVYEELKDKVMSSKHVISVVGMPGIGKTTLVNKIFNDTTLVKDFDHRMWIQVGKKYRAKDIPRCMLEEMDPDGLQMLPEKDEEAVAEYLKATLKNKRYLIVLDDVWDRFTMNFLCPNVRHSLNLEDVEQHFLHLESESRILITGRLQQLNNFREAKHVMITMRLLNREESWDLLREKVFSKRSCPPQLVKAGMKISENCEGLPLTILEVAR